MNTVREDLMRDTLFICEKGAESEGFCQAKCQRNQKYQVKPKVAM